MYCEHCGTKLNKKDSYCSKCGSKIKVLHDNANINDTINYYDQDFIDAYIGKNKEKIKTNKFSFPTFFFGIWYLLYRKMWLFSIIWLTIICIFNCLDLDYTEIILLVICLFFALLFNKLYLRKANRKVQKIRNKYKDKSNEDLIKLLKKSGGTTVVPIVITICLIVISFFIILTVSIYQIMEEKVTDKFKFQEQYHDNDYELNYLLPKQFELKTNSSYYQNYSYVGDSSYCTVTIKNIKSYLYSDAKDYMEQNIYVRSADEVSPIEEKNINQSRWFYQGVKSTSNSKYYYASLYQGRIYFVEFNIYQDDDNFCMNSYNSFIKSLNFKNNSSNVNSI